MTTGIYRLYFIGGLTLGTILPLILLLSGVPYLMGLMCGVLIVGGIYVTEYLWVKVPQLIPLA